ncbi:MAG: 3-dehydroquinate synthase [Candidatus Binataceae bacterium]
MRTFRVELGARSYPVHVGEELLGKVGELAREAGLEPGRAAIITDSNVAPLYADSAIRALKDARFDPVLIEFAAGEESKSLATLETIFDRLVAAEMERGSAIFALGGGVVGDLAGFAAATYLRGIAVVQIPTTTTAQVDSALGGKTGVNHRAAKNLIGSFHEPRMIVADVSTLKSLKERDFREGLAEVIKYAAIMDAPMMILLERDMPAILKRGLGPLEDIVERSLRNKAYVITQDELESGLRRILNFGHTVGHALEAGLGYGSYLHGEAVAVGMAIAARLSCAMTGLSENDAARLTRLIERAGLPATMPSVAREEFIRALKLDKKRVRAEIEFVLLDSIGHAVTRRVGFEQIIACLNLG